MRAGVATGGGARNLILAAMIFAVSMTFIDQTIVSIAVPQIQRELGLTSTGVQWNLVLGVSMIVFIPVFFFASEYAQISLGKSPSQGSLVLLYFFLGFALWAGKVTDLQFSKQLWFVVMSGAGMGFMLGPATTDAVNRASRLSYGEATGITQTVRNFAASLGLAILGTILVDKMRTHVTASLIRQHVPAAQASTEASSISQSQGNGTGGVIPHFVRLDFAEATHTVLLCMSGVMAVAAAIAFVGLRRGVQVESDAVTVGAD